MFKRITNLFFILAVTPLLLLSGAGSLHAATLFTEDFSGGFGANWTANDPGNGQTATEDVGGGDFAAFTVGPAPYDSTDWQYNFRSTASYARGNDLRCTFKAWRDPSKPTWAGAVNFGILGPFHTTSFNSTFVYANMSVVMDGGAGTFGFNAEGPFNTGDPASVPLAAAWNASSSKANGVWFRITLGNTDGGLCEWSTDGVNYTVESDYRDLGAPYSSADPVILAFGTHAGAVFIDDIVLEDSTGIVGPEINVSPIAGLNFGFFTEGTGPSPSQCLEIQNLGTTDLSFTNIVISGPNAVQFDFETPPSTAILAAGATREVCVVYDPFPGTGNTAHVASVRIDSDDVDEPMLNISLKGVSNYLVPPPQEKLFTEDWETGGFNISKWDVYNAGGSGCVCVENATGGFAAFTVGPAPPYDFTDYSYYYYSTNTFPRGNSLRCTFKTWKDPTKPTWAGPVNFGIFGPFHDAQNTAQIYGNIDTGLEGGSLPLNFNDNSSFNAGVPTSGAFQAAFNASTEKANGVWVRVTLGDVRGGKFEWSTDGVNYNPEIDNRNISGASTENVYLGFGTHAGAVFIDDICLEREAFIPSTASGVDDWSLYE